MAIAAPKASFADDDFSVQHGPAPLWRDGPAPGKLYQFPGSACTSDSRQRTTQPIVTGTSVLGVRFNGGVMISADTLGSYGSLARYRKISRIMAVNQYAILGASGDIADFQYLKEWIKSIVISDQEVGVDPINPASLFCLLTRVLYNRRTKFNPLWNNVVVAGFREGKSFLGLVDKIGVAFEDTSVATGYGAYIAQPIMRKTLEDKGGELTQEEARELLIRCMRILYYRDCRGFDKFEIATVTADGTNVEEIRSLTTDWSMSHMVTGYE